MVLCLETITLLFVKKESVERERGNLKYLEQNLEHFKTKLY